MLSAIEADILVGGQSDGRINLGKFGVTLKPES